MSSSNNGPEEQVLSLNEEEEILLTNSTRNHQFQGKQVVKTNVKLITTFCFIVFIGIILVVNVRYISKRQLQEEQKPKMIYLKSQEGNSIKEQKPDDFLIENKRIKLKLPSENSQISSKIKQQNPQKVQILQVPVIKDFYYYLQKYIYGKVEKPLPKQLLEQQGKKTYRNSGVSFWQMAKAQMYRSLVDNPDAIDLAKQEYAYYEEKYNISKYEELRFCVAVSGYNNVAEDRYKRNILSILQQNYTNYHVVYYDDASPDETGKALIELLSKHPLKDRVKVIINTINKSSLENLVDAAKNHCDSHDIFFRVDGDDEIIGRQVLKFFNAIYHQQKVWNVYATSITSQHKVGLSRPYSKKVIQRNDYRYAHFSFFHQTSFYTELVRKIKDEDLKDQKGQFLKASSDNVLLTPIYEMCHEKIAYIPEVTYFWNRSTGINQYARKKNIQRQVGRRMKLSPKYDSLSNLFDQK